MWAKWTLHVLLDCLSFLFLNSAYLTKTYHWKKKSQGHAAEGNGLLSGSKDSRHTAFLSCWRMTNAIFKSPTLRLLPVPRGTYYPHTFLDLVCSTALGALTDCQGLKGAEWLATAVVHRVRFPGSPLYHLEIIDPGIDSGSHFFPLLWSLRTGIEGGSEPGRDGNSQEHRNFLV